MVPPEPWHALLTGLDSRMEGELRLYCLGGFAMSMRYGFSRPTGDIDYMAVIPNGQIALIQEIAGPESRLCKRLKVYLQHVAVQTVPEDYRERSVEMFAGAYRFLQLYALDPYDLALSKLERNGQKDRDDVKYLARTVPLDPEILKDRYGSEMRPYLANQARHDLTLRLWLEMIGEVG